MLPHQLLHVEPAIHHGVDLRRIRVQHVLREGLKTAYIARFLVSFQSRLEVLFGLQRIVGIDWPNGFVEIAVTAFEMMIGKTAIDLFGQGIDAAVLSVDVHLGVHTAWHRIAVLFEQPPVKSLAHHPAVMVHRMELQSLHAIELVLLALPVHFDLQ